MLQNISLGIRLNGNDYSTKMELSEALEKRLEEKGVTKYAIAKQLAEAEGKGKAPTAFTTRVGKIIADPKGRVFSNLEEVVKLLGGEIYIRWTDTKDQAIH